MIHHQTNPKTKLTQPNTYKPLGHLSKLHYLNIFFLLFSLEILKNIIFYAYPIIYTKASTNQFPHRFIPLHKPFEDSNKLISQIYYFDSRHQGLIMLEESLKYHKYLIWIKSMC